jgi:purine-binding chemotaxis protein CheW
LGVPKEERRSLLVCRVRARLCAVPLEHVVETLRPLPIEPLGDQPAFVLGLTRLRGDATPVVDLGVLLGLGDTIPHRFISLRAGSRHVALAVEEVLGVREIQHSALSQLPPLLREANADFVTSLATVDTEFLLVLNAARIFPSTTLPGSAGSGAS